MRDRFTNSMAPWIPTEPKFNEEVLRNSESMA